MEKGVVDPSNMERSENGHMKWLQSRPKFTIQAFYDQLQLFQASFSHFGKFEFDSEKEKWKKFEKEKLGI